MGNGGLITTRLGGVGILVQHMYYLPGKIAIALMFVQSPWDLFSR